MTILRLQYQTRGCKVKVLMVREESISSPAVLVQVSRTSLIRYSSVQNCRKAMRKFNYLSLFDMGTIQALIKEVDFECLQCMGGWMPFGLSVCTRVFAAFHSLFPVFLRV